MDRQNSLENALAFWQGKAAKLKLLGEDEIYEWEYAACQQKIALFQRLLDKRIQRLLCLNIKANQ